MAEQNVGESYLVSKRYAYYVFIVLFIIYMVDYIDRYVVSGLVPFLKAPIESGGLSFTDTQCGLLMSAVYWSIVVLTFPFSILLDRWRRTRSIGVMVVFWSLATGACAFAQSFKGLFVARVGVGIGEAGYVPGGYSLIAAYFPQRIRALMIGIWNASIPLGVVIGSILGGIIATKYGWRHAFGIMAIPGLILSILFFTMKDYKTVKLVKTVGNIGSGAEKVKMSVRDIAIEFLTTPSLLFTFFSYAGIVFVNNAILFWLPTYFNRTEGIAMPQATMKASLIFLLAVIGAPIGGIITDWLYKKRKSARMVFPAFSTGVATALLFTALFFAVGKNQYYFLLAFGFFVPMFVVGSAAVTQDVVHPGLRSISASLNIVVQNLLGASIGPIFVGMISDRNGGDLMVAFRYLPIFFGTAAVLFLLGSFFYMRDLAKVERVPLKVEG